MTGQDEQRPVAVEPADAAVERPGRVFGRRRRANAPVESARRKRYTVLVSAAEDAQLRERAAAREVTVSRLLFEAAMSAGVTIDAERKAHLVELFALRQQLAGVARNANQLARFANSEGRFPVEAEAALAEYRALVPKITAALEAVAGP